MYWSSIAGQPRVCWQDGGFLRKSNFGGTTYDFGGSLHGAAQLIPLPRATATINACIREHLPPKQNTTTHVLKKAFGHVPPLDGGFIEPLESQSRPSMSMNGNTESDMCVLCCHPIYSGRQSCGRTSRGDTGERLHGISPPYFCGACLTSRGGFSRSFPSSTVKSNFV